jgi:hypothetical protein
MSANSVPLSRLDFLKETKAKGGSPIQLWISMYYFVATRSAGWCARECGKDNAVT